MSWTIILVVGLRAARPSTAQAQAPPRAAVTVADGTARPGTVASVVLSADLPARVELATLQFAVTVVPEPGAAALVAPIAFTSRLPLGPSLDFNEGDTTVLVGWLQPIVPRIAGGTELGTLAVPIPTEAAGGDRYVVEIHDPSATSDGLTNVPLAPASGVVTVAGATTTTSTTTMTASPTTTSTATTAPPREVCGNCLDDDRNGLTDFEDPACCGGTTRRIMNLQKARIRRTGDRSRLLITSVLPDLDFTPRDDVILQLAGVGSTTGFCARLPAVSFRGKARKRTFKHPNASVASAQGIDQVSIEMRRDGTLRLVVTGKRAAFRAPSAGDGVRVSVGLRDQQIPNDANRCAATVTTFHASRNGELKFP